MHDWPIKTKYVRELYNKMLYPHKAAEKVLKSGSNEIKQILKDICFGHLKWFFTAYLLALKESNIISSAVMFKSL